MSDKRLISIDFHSDFGFFRKPDVNAKQGLQHRFFSYNMLHRPALLGILGAIAGLNGFDKGKNEENFGVVPAYYEALKGIQMGIAPLQSFHNKGNFTKNSVVYSNSVGYASFEQGGTWVVEESVLRSPGYTCFLLLNLGNKFEKKIYEYLKNGYAEYVPYFGKNEFQISWFNKDGDNTFTEYESVFPEKPLKMFEMKTIFTSKTYCPILKSDPDDENSEMPYFYFERLPVRYTTQFFLQYDKLLDFKFTNCKIKPESDIDNLFKIGNNQYAQLFN